jgi:choline dehydrogenase-like flavoprotein
VYVRRRFTFTEEFQLRHELPNIAGWLANPELPDAGHRSGMLSFVYLALSSPMGPKLAPDAQRLSLTGSEIPGTPYGGALRTSRMSHARNIARQPLSTGRFMVGFGAKRFLARERRSPGFFVYNRDNLYPFQFHGEHLPNPSSTVSLSEEVDALGRHKLDIDLRFADQDIDGIVRAHQYWDSYLRSSGVGRIEYLHPDVHEAVARRLGGGFHQIGTTRMSASPTGGVVDGNLAVHGTENVFVASSSTFVTSGQANSTFMIVAYAIRLAEHLGSELRSR